MIRRRRRPRDQPEPRYPPEVRAAWWAGWLTVGVHLWWTWP